MRDSARCCLIFIDWRGLTIRSVWWIDIHVFSSCAQCARLMNYLRSPAIPSILWRGSKTIGRARRGWTYVVRWYGCAESRTMLCRFLFFRKRSRFGDSVVYFVSISVVYFIVYLGCHHDTGVSVIMTRVRGQVSVTMTPRYHGLHGVQLQVIHVRFPFATPALFTADNSEFLQPSFSPRHRSARHSSFAYDGFVRVPASAFRVRCAR